MKNNRLTSSGLRLKHISHLTCRPNAGPAQPTSTKPKANPSPVKPCPAQFCPIAVHNRIKPFLKEHYVHAFLNLITHFCLWQKTFLLGQSKLLLIKTFDNGISAYQKLEIKPFRLGSRIWDMEAKWRLRVIADTISWWIFGKQNCRWGMN